MIDELLLRNNLEKAIDNSKIKNESNMARLYLEYLIDYCHSRSCEECELIKQESFCVQEGRIEE